MADMRVAGMTLPEMYAMAQASEPEVASASRDGFTKVATGLGQVSQTLSGSLDKIGTGWRGQGAQGARGGIGQHVQWAQSTSEEARAVAGNAEQHAQSVRFVKDNMPDPAKVTGAAAAQPGPDGKPNTAAVESAMREAEQRGRELLQQHAGNCRSNTPRSALAAPPTAGSGAAVRATSATGRAAGRGRTTGVAAPDARAGRGGDTVGAGGSGGRTTSASSPPRATPPGETEPRVGSGAAGGRSSPQSSSQPGGFGATVPASTGYLAELAGRRTQHVGYVPADGAVPSSRGTARVRGRGPGAEVRGIAPAGVGQPGPATRPLLARGERYADTAHHDDYGTAPSGGEHTDQQGRGGHHGQSGRHGGVLSPTMAGQGAGGSPDSGQRHETPAYLLDDFELFDGDSWVVPPVIGK